MVPLLARPVAAATFVPLAVPTMLAAFILALRDAATAHLRVPAADSHAAHGLSPR